MSVSEALGRMGEVALDAGTVRYRERGSGPTLLFVHGLLVNGDLWRRVVPLLADRFRCIAPDLPLGAHSPALQPGADVNPPGVARIVADFMEALDLRDVTLVGSDTGGAVCQLVVANHRDRLTGLVLTNCDAFENFPPPLLRPFQWATVIPGFVLGLAHALRTRPARAALVFPLARRVPEPAVLDGYFRPILDDAGVRRDLTAFLRGISNRQTLRAAESFGSFDGSVLIVWAPRDPIFRIRDGERLAQAFPTAHLERVTGSRTFISEDRPEALAELIAEHVAQAAARSPSASASVPA